MRVGEKVTNLLYRGVVSSSSQSLSKAYNAQAWTYSDVCSRIAVIASGASITDRSPIVISRVRVLLSWITNANRWLSRSITWSRVKPNSWVVSPSISITIRRLFHRSGVSVPLYRSVTFAISFTVFFTYYNYTAFDPKVNGYFRLKMWRFVINTLNFVDLCI